MRLIDADEMLGKLYTIKELYEQISRKIGIEGVDKDSWFVSAICDVQDMVNECKTVDTVKHAHVIVNFDGDTKCSECGCKHIDSAMPYCANCGARLDEPTERESFNE